MFAYRSADFSLDCVYCRMDHKHNLKKQTKKHTHKKNHRAMNNSTNKHSNMIQRIVVVCFVFEINKSPNDPRKHKLCHCQTMFTSKLQYFRCDTQRQVVRKIIRNLSVTKSVRCWCANPNSGIPLVDQSIGSALRIHKSLAILNPL